MSKGKIFYIVDVFAEEKYAGNQLAVVRDAAGLSDSEMQNITKEMNYSETTFILSDDRRNGGYDVRIFTPAQEVPFAGHPTLGTAYIIQQEIIKEPIEKIILNLKVGRIPVTFNYTGKEKNVLRMKQIEPTFGQIIEPEPIAEVLSLNTSDIDEKFPVQAKAILVFCPETYSQENDLNVRVFVDYYGIPEDPATGSGNGCLAGYLVKNRYFDKDQIDIRAEQGYEIARPSLIYLRAKDTEGQIDISVGGKVVMVAKGKLA
ncbi:MAG: PhzF family phenazine biosynthesis protein [Planctomycetota bacterium]|jgi:trans-2,3-dihydro-3-hydroxyanthranilate isomerase